MTTDQRQQAINNLRDLVFSEHKPLSAEEQLLAIIAKAEKHAHHDPELAQWLLLILQVITQQGPIPEPVIKHSAQALLRMLQQSLTSITGRFGQSEREMLEQLIAAVQVSPALSKIVGAQIDALRSNALLGSELFELLEIVSLTCNQRKHPAFALTKRRDPARYAQARSSSNDAIAPQTIERIQLDTTWRTELLLALGAKESEPFAHSAIVATRQLGTDACHVISELRDDPNARPLIVERLKSASDTNDPGGWLRRAAIDALKDDPVARPLILNCLTDENANARVAAIGALKDDRRARAIILELFKNTSYETDPSGEVRAAAIEALKDDAAAKPLILECLQNTSLATDPEASVRIAALNALKDDSVAREIMLDYLRNTDDDIDRDSAVCIAAMYLLKNDSAARPLIIHRLTDRFAHVRHAATQALAAYPSERPLILERLQSASPATDTDLHIRIRAIYALKDDPDARPWLRDRLKDHDNSVRRAAIEALVGDVESQALILDCLQNSSDENDPGGDVLAAAIEALQNDPAAWPLIFKRLQQASEDNDPHHFVRENAIRALKQDSAWLASLLAHLNDPDQPETSTESYDLESETIQDAIAAPATAALLSQRLRSSQYSVRKAVEQAIPSRRTPQPTDVAVRHSHGVQSLRGHWNAPAALEERELSVELISFITHPTDIHLAEHPALSKLIHQWMILRLAAADRDALKAADNRIFGLLREEEDRTIVHIHMQPEDLAETRRFCATQNMLEALRVAQHVVSRRPHEYWLICADVSLDDALAALPTMPNGYFIGGSYYGFRTRDELGPATP